MKLKHFRIIFSSLLLIAFLAVFFFSFKFTIILGKIITSTQFTPTFVKFVFSWFSPISFGFILIMILTLIFGRVYCSFLCPLGIFQDMIIFIRTRIKKRFKYMKPYNFIKYIILSITVFSAIIGSFFLVNLLDPYSIFSRIMTNLFKPLINIISNFFVFIMKNMKLYLTYDAKSHNFNIWIFLSSLLFLFLISIFSIIKGRLFCNTICPVGTVLSIISRFSFFKIRINENKCTKCGKCEHVCKASCIDSKNKTVDNSRCIACYNCSDICKFDALSYKFQIDKTKKIDISKRRLIKETPLIIFSAAVVTALPIRIFSQDKILNTSYNKNLITPPGSISLENFTNSCIGCHLCVRVCPTKVLEPTFIEYGLTGMFQPKMNYNASFCDFECNSCSIVCPSGAIAPQKVIEKKQIQIGQVKLVKKHCIVYEKYQDCGACAEHCPTKAVHMVPWNNLYGPETNTDLCVGCGACEHVCPAKPIKAITVTANNIHKKAKIKNMLEEDEIIIIESEKDDAIKEETTDDFPF